MDEGEYVCMCVCICGWESGRECCGCMGGVGGLGMEMGEWVTMLPPSRVELRCIVLISYERRKNWLALITRCGSPAV
jgi:hypothetical protein